MSLRRPTPSTLSFAILAILLLLICSTLLSSNGTNPYIDSRHERVLPVANTHHWQLNERDDGSCVGAFYCTDRDWEGQCMHDIVTSGTCVHFSPQFDRSVSSFGPDEDNCAECYLFEYVCHRLLHMSELTFCVIDVGNNSKPNCVGDSWTLRYPGRADGGMESTNGNPWEDSLSSYKCIATCSD